MGRKGFLRGNARSLDHGIYLKKYVLVTLLRINVHVSRTYIFWTDSSIMAQQGAGMISPTLSHDFSTVKWNYKEKATTKATNVIVDG